VPSPFVSAVFYSARRGGANVKDTTRFPVAKLGSFLYSDPLPHEGQRHKAGIGAQ
jgi:hypothetical protein